MSLEDEIRNLIGQLTDKCQREKPDDAKLAEAVMWIALAYRWLALPKVAARKAPEPE